MARTIPELITAVFGGETITQTEADRVLRHLRRGDRIADLPRLRVSPARQRHLTRPR